ncbi:hypothetical protein [Actinoplanes sp. G11-F43]|uniref:hypothetical protein n=1 Tax=Actinoplanes sp. G11-F43 TaxID=3424130 RepID=UPI003D327150
MTTAEPEAPVTVTATEPEMPVTGRQPSTLPRRLIIAGVSALAGAGVAVAALLTAGWRHVPVERYEVRVFFVLPATADQKESVRAALDGLPAAQGKPILRTRDEAWAEYTKRFTDAGDPVPSVVTRETIREYATVSTTGRDFDCTPVTAVKTAPGVESVQVAVYTDGPLPIEATAC